MNKRVFSFFLAIIAIAVIVGYRLFDSRYEWDLGVVPVEEYVTEHAIASASRYHSFVIKPDGSLWGWGGNEYGQLGDGTTNSHDEPIMIMSDIVYVSANHRRTFAIDGDGTLWAWGNNARGQLGDGTTEDRFSPVPIMQNVSAVASSSDHTIVIRTDGSLWGFGNRRGLGWNISATGDREAFRKYPIHLMDDIIDIAAGVTYSLVLKNDGTLWAFGGNNEGQLGDGTARDRDNPIQVLDNVTAVAAGTFHSAAIRTDGSLWTWGSNNFGQLGDVRGTRRTTPERVLENVATVSLGAFHTLALKEDGSLYSFGSSMSGQLGREHITTVTIFRRIPGISRIRRWEIDEVRVYINWEPEKIMSSVAYISAGDQHTLVVRRDGSIWAFGDNRENQLGVSSIRENTIVPVRLF